MAVTEKRILNRMYFVATCLFLFVVAVVVKLCAIQFVDGEKYRELAENRTIKKVTIPANRGNVYAADGSLLAMSIPKYDIRFDALTPTAKNFETNLSALSDSLSSFFGKPKSYYQNVLRKARANKNRYFLIARNLGYSDYSRVRNFPLLNQGAFKGGLIVEQSVKREHPMGGIAQRTIGYERVDEEGNVTRAGMDGAFGVQYLRGTDGKRLKQKIGNGQWKPIADYNEIEPKNGFDVYTTLDVNIQDIAHHSLLEQLEKFNADHGCVVVMEVETGEIRAMANLGRNSEGYYYERRNYAIWESHEPGSTFKLMALTAALEDKVVDTSDVVDTKKGVLTFYGKNVRDSHHGGYGKISLAKAFEVSSNTGIVAAIDKHYSKNPQKFVDRLHEMSLDQKLDLPIIGEGDPIIPQPGDKSRWSGIALQWMAYGYGVSFTPLQTLTFYNAIANDGEMVRPQFLREVREFDETIVPFHKEVINPKVCSDETLKKVQDLLKNVVEKKHGTGHKLYSPSFSMAGKTGTCQKDYANKDNYNYISSFAGYFPAENPKYSCIVVIHEPDKSVGYYGADVSGPVFKKIAQKIYTDTPISDEVPSLEVNDSIVEKNFDTYYALSRKQRTSMPNVVGLPMMDAVSLLENLGLKVKTDGVGTVKRQSIPNGEKISTNEEVILSI
ncbi:penicillin-binding protein [Aegicerativicinus sediminis]|uniref:penicillin-binding protein n=1 Tax=Aegicerativicinus sediminis TaxID=2893202 RepID=UPI001E298080|nr:penicillin-binding protein [Aegicerativicinus sediminis]